LLIEGFARLSPQSRYLRFFGPKDRLSDAELSYLTELDGVNHFAIGALAAGEWPERGIGIGRFVRLTTEPTVAELAITIVDAEQRKGRGSALCARLVEAARERGIRRFRAEIMPSNAGMHALLRSQASQRRRRTATGGYLFDLDARAPLLP